VNKEFAVGAAEPLRAIILEASNMHLITPSSGIQRPRYGAYRDISQRLRG